MPPPSPNPTRRRWLFAALAVLVFLLLLLTPPLVSVNRLQRRIATSMSQSLGRPVHLDRATLHLLPVPGFTLENLVVSEDPAFGAEPVIRANLVEATLRPSSLWRRQVELSSIRFVDPSLNLVRNKAGQWNLQSLLIHAAQVETAPTAQAKAGPAPRFPYVEATGGRINLKLGDEKTPFSLLDADFALWLPRPDEWRVRLVGKPARTDLNAADTGRFRMEGSLQRGGRMAEVPVDLHGSWQGVPLGEASKLILGRDAGWRGALTVESALAGPLGSAHWTANIAVNDLRRADFVPAQEMHLELECNATLETPEALAHDPTCALETPKADGFLTPGRVVATADQIQLQNTIGLSAASGLLVGMTNVPNTWLLDWLRLFSQRVPPGEHPGGVTAGSVLYDAQPHTAGAWRGEFHTNLTARLPWDAPEAVASSYAVTAAIANSTATLPAVNLKPAGPTPLLLSGQVSATGYAVRLAGSATPAELAEIQSAMPALGDGLDAITSGLDATPLLQPQTVNLICARTWNAAPLCTALALPSAKKIPARHHR